MGLPESLDGQVLAFPRNVLALRVPPPVVVSPSHQLGFAVLAQAISRGEEEQNATGKVDQLQV